STGLWAPQLEEVVVSGGVKATIHVALVDDLTGRESHELSLRRPPRVQKSFEYDGNHLAFKVPYGGLIYIQPYHVEEEKGVTYTFSGVLKADYWNNGKWVNKSSDGVPLAEIDTGHFIYTTPVENTTALDVDKFVEELNFFAESASDFYGRDSKASHSLHQR
ncbi:TPA: M60 family peptidase N-terminal accessory domain-containing protein, partial [Vibrio parahaemolyticus]